MFCCVAIYIGSLVYVGSHGGSLEEPLFGLLILGVGFSALAWFATRRAAPLPPAAGPARHERLLVFLSLLIVCLWLVSGREWSAAILLGAGANSGVALDLVTLAGKVIAFVMIPVFLLRVIGGQNWAGLGFTGAAFTELRRSHLPVVLAVSGAILLFQFFIGSGAAPLRNGELGLVQIMLGLPLCFLWLTVEVGLVEEFFFVRCCKRALRPGCVPNPRGSR